MKTPLDKNEINVIARAKKSDFALVSKLKKNGENGFPIRLPSAINCSLVELKITQSSQNNPLFNKLRENATK